MPQHTSSFRTQRSRTASAIGALTVAILLAACGRSGPGNGLSNSTTLGTPDSAKNWWIRSVHSGASEWGGTPSISSP